MNKLKRSLHNLLRGRFIEPVMLAVHKHSGASRLSLRALAAVVLRFFNKTLFFIRQHLTYRWRTHPIRVVSGLFLLALLGLDLSFPPPIPRSQPGLIVLARDGTPLRSWPDEDGVWRFPTQPENVSKTYLDALHTYEDRWFYYHVGVNPLALARAGWQWIRFGKIISGGSTLTMQAARAIEPMPHSFKGKIKQSLRALQLEVRLSKKEILTLYLNYAPMGGIVEGVEMASRTYLGKPASQLSHAEAALLVVLPQAPSRLRPDRHPDVAQKWRDKVLTRMAERQVWSEAIVADARMEKVMGLPPRMSWLAPIVAERLRQYARRNARAGHASEVMVQSTIDRDIQLMVERILGDKVTQLPRMVSMAALVVDSKTMDVLAYAGSADFQDAQRFSHVDMVKGIRSPGSTLKPFLYAMALDEGIIHSESLLSDVPQSFSGYDPGNFQSNFSGPVSVSDALQRSLNVPAVDLLDRLGPARFSARLENGGLKLVFPKDSKPNLSLILGGAGTNLEQLVGAYRALSMQGKSANIRLTPNSPLKEMRMMSSGAAYIIRAILEAGGNPDYAFIETQGRRLAWKTGTSYGFRDAWAIGVADGYTLGVWIGRPDGTPNPGFFGANVAAPLLHHIAQALPARGEVGRSRPEDVSTATICWPLGGAATQTEPEHCHLKRSAWILKNTIPPTLSDRIRAKNLLETLWFDPKTQERTRPDCNPNAQAKVVARWPAQLENWLTPAQIQRFDLAGLQRWEKECAPNEWAKEIKLLGINPDTRIRKAVNQGSIKVSIEAVGGGPKLYWFLNGELQAHQGKATRHTFEVTRSGDQQISVLDAAGHQAQLHFRVDD